MEAGGGEERKVSEIYPFIKRHMLNTFFYVPSMSLGTGDKVVNRTKMLCKWEHNLSKENRQYDE